MTSPVAKRSTAGLETWLIGGLLLLLVGLVVATVLLGSVPPVDRDALTHHLFVPRLWLEHGGIHEIPEIPFSYYPMNLDLLYTVPLALGNDIVPKYIHYLFALLTALVGMDILKVPANLMSLGAVDFGVVVDGAVVEVSAVAAAAVGASVEAVAVSVAVALRGIGKW